MISFDLYGDPTPQKRARHSRINGRIRTFNPQKSEREQIQWQIKSQFKEDPFTIPLALDMIFLMPIPESSSGIKKKQMANGLIAHTKKPDLDNLAKFILDAMNNLVFKDDSQVIEIRMKKIYSSKPGTVVRIIPMAGEKRELLYENCARDFR